MEKREPVRYLNFENSFSWYSQLMDYKRNPNCRCFACGVPIYRRPSVLRSFSHVYCSTQCYRKANAKPLIKCAQCGTEFTPNTVRSKYCSHRCSNLARTGIRYLKRGYTNSSIHHLITLRKAFEFNACMVTGCTYGRTLDVHRLIPGKAGGAYEIGNMVALCPNHHAEVTRGLIRLEKVSDQEVRAIHIHTEGCESGLFGLS